MISALGTQMHNYYTCIKNIHFTAKIYPFIWISENAQLFLLFWCIGDRKEIKTSSYGIENIYLLRAINISRNDILGTK